MPYLHRDLSNVTSAPSIHLANHPQACPPRLLLRRHCFRTSCTHPLHNPLPNCSPNLDLDLLNPGNLTTGKTSFSVEVLLGIRFDSALPGLLVRHIVVACLL
jgi:hypothetical protein